MNMSSLFKKGRKMNLTKNNLDSRLRGNDRGKDRDLWRHKKYERHER